VLIYDTPPSLEHTATAAAVRDADIVLVVTSPSPADLWEGKAAVKFAKKKNGQTKIRVMCNKVRRTTVLGKLVTESVKDGGAPMLPTIRGKFLGLPVVRRADSQVIKKTEKIPNGLDGLGKNLTRKKQDVLSVLLNALESPLLRGDRHGMRPANNSMNVSYYLVRSCED